MADTALSGLSAASALDGTEIYPAAQGGNSRGVTGAQIQTMVRRAGSTTAGSWPVMGSGTVLATPVAGAEEFDGYCQYFSPADASRAVALADYFVCVAGNTSLTNTANLQKIFAATTNGELTLPVGLYFFEALLAFYAMDTTQSTNALIDILGAGTATLDTILYHAIGNDLVATTANTQSGCMMVQKDSPASIVTGGTAAQMQVSLRGTFRVTGVGTIIPSVKLSTAAAASIRDGSFFRCRCMGSATATYCGNWS